MNKFLLRVAVSVLLFSLLPVQAENSKMTAPVKPCVIQDTITQQTPSVENLVGHFNNKIKIVFSDIDWTIMPPKKENAHADAPPSVKIAVKKLHNAKIPLILATGRVYPEAKELSEKIGVGGTYLITQQGAEIRNPQGKLIYQDGLDHINAVNMLNYLQDFKKANNSTFSILVVIDGKFYSTEKLEIPYIWSKVNQIKSFDELGDTFAPTSICIYEPTMEKLKFVQAGLKKHFPSYHIDISSAVFCDITSATATKGNAIKKMSELLGVDLKNSATFGDAENDISMLSLVKSKGGAAVAVGNAMDSVKASASFVTLSVLDGGFAHAIDKILENNALLNR